MVDQLKALLSKMGEIWGQIGLNQRISIVLTGGAVLAGIITVGLISTDRPGMTLAANISTSEAAEITQALQEEKIPYEISGAENTITVPRDAYHRARMRLAVRGIPQSNGKGYEVFEQPSFGKSDFLQRVQHQVALQQELEMTIEELDEVESVRVHIVPPKRTLLVDPTTLPKASVFIKKARMQLSMASVEAIQSLVAHAVEGLEPSNVTVVDEQARLLSRDMSDDSIEAIAEGQLKARRDHEKYLTDKVQDMLDHVLGFGKSKVSIDVSLTTDSVQQVSRMYNPTNQVVLNSITQEQYEISSSADGGVPGVPTNAPATTNSMALPPGFNSTTNIIKDIQFGNEELTTTTTKTPGTITNISASVIVDTRYQTGTNGVLQPLMRTPEEIGNLRSAVMTALSIRDTNTISVIQMPFEKTDTGSVLTDLRQMDQRMFYFELVKQLLYLALPVMFFFGFVRMWKKSSADAIPLGVPVGQLGGQEESSEASAAEVENPADAEVANTDGTSGNGEEPLLNETDSDDENPEAAEPSGPKPNRTYEEPDYELDLPFSEEELMAGLSDAERQEIQEKIRKINQWVHEKPDTVVRTVRNWLDQEDEKSEVEAEED
jgi:flagellar M-ring protein FliF